MIDVAVAHERELRGAHEHAAALALEVAKASVDAHFVISNGHMEEILRERDLMVTKDAMGPVTTDVTALKLEAANRAGRMAMLVALLGVAQMLFTALVGLVMYFITHKVP